MNRYRIIADVLSAQGQQVFEVEAKDEEDARSKYLRDDGVTFVSEEIEVTKLTDRPTIERVSDG